MARTTLVVRQFRPSRATALTVLGLVTLAIVLAVRGAQFYALSVTARVDSPDFRVLSPGSTIGHGYGVIGTVLILTNLLYLIRRRLRPNLPIGSLQAWLAMHVFTGLSGSTLILFHSAFQLRTPIATVTSIALFATVLTGLLGRYLHTVTPKPDTHRLGLSIAALDEYAKGLGPRIMSGLRQLPPTPAPEHATMFASLRLMPTWWRERRARRRVVFLAVEEAIMASVDPHVKGEMKRIGGDAESIAGREVGAIAANAILRSWRGVHRIVAIIMVLSVSLHIGVAIMYGYWWILS